jgi:hypothetical protein
MGDYDPVVGESVEQRQRLAGRPAVEDDQLEVNPAAIAYSRRLGGER